MPKPLALLIVLLLATPSAPARRPPWANPHRSPAARARALRAAMTADEKLDLVTSGEAGIARLGIPPLSFIDGPNGVGHASTHVTAFPNAVTLAASWDTALARRFGEALGAEASGKGYLLLFAPTVNIVRTPKWGRSAETLSEDPFLAGAIAAEEIRGIQSQHVIAQVKHYVANNQETSRFGNPLASDAVNVVVSERALREIYTPAFAAAIGAGGAASVMCSYNRLNGQYPCQDSTTLGILREFGFSGFVGPDASLAVRDSTVAANAGVDNFQLGSLASAAGVPMRTLLGNAIASGAITSERVDAMVENVLRALFAVGAYDHPPRGDASSDVSTAEHLALAEELAADATVLLENRNAVLPLGSDVHTIAVIGHDAGPGTQIAQGGSPAVLPSGPIVTPLDAIVARAGSGVQVTHVDGTLGLVPLALVPSDVLVADPGPGAGFTGTYYAATTFSGTPVLTRVDASLDFESGSIPLAPIPGTTAHSARWTATLVPPVTGRYRFSLTTSGVARLFVAGTLVASGDTEFWTGGTLSPGANPVTLQGLADLTMGVGVPITIEYSTGSSIGGAALHFGWQPPDPALMADAVAAAHAADVAIVFAAEPSAEGMDRTSLALSGDQDDLIAAVAAANPRTVVVLHTPGPVLMPWANDVAAIVEAWYPGQQSGRAIAATLFGDRDPAGRLPVTWPSLATQGPTVQAANFPGVNNEVHYDEGILVGYRFYDARSETPLYPFGFGRSYTTFETSRLRVQRLGKRRVRVTVNVANTGARAGAEVVQVYVAFPDITGEPPNQLKGFAKVRLQPGRRTRARITLDRAAFAHWSEATHDWVVTPETYTVRVGTSSRELTLESSVRVR